MAGLATRLVAAACLVAGFCGAAWAQTYPNKRITLVAPFAAGSGTDVVARIVAKELSARIGQPITVENQSGASGIPGAAAVARAEPDGYTLLLNSSGHTILPSTEANLPFDVITDFAPVALVTSGPILLVANIKFQPSTFGELVALAKAKPGTINFAHTGVGTVPFLAMEMVKKRAGIDMVAVAYRGGAPAMIDVGSGVIELYLSSFPAAGPFLEAGKVKVLGLSSATVPDFVKAMPLVKDVKPIADQGIPGFDIQLWYGIFAPAKTPRNIIEYLEKEIAEVLRTPSVRQTLTNLGIEPKYMNSEEFASYIKSEVNLWKEITQPPKK